MSQRRVAQRGTPDFGQRLEAQGLTIFSATDEADLFVYQPRQLEIAPREGNATGPNTEPDFAVETVRCVNPFKPPQPYGVLDFRLRPQPFSLEALETLRQSHPSATVTLALFQHGWLRLTKLASDAAPDVATTAFETPEPLSSNGLDATRYMRRLTQDEVTLVKRVLQEETLTFTAVAEMEMWGQAQRLPVRLDFDPATLLNALRQCADSQGLLKFSQLIDFWMQDATHLPITPLEGFDKAERAALAQTLADWTVAGFAISVPCPSLPVQPTWMVQAPQELPSIVRWDLQQEKLVPHLVLLELNPFEAAQQVVNEQGLESVLHETVVPELETGVASLTIATNLPDAIQGVLLLGADLLAPPHPPQRVQPLSASLLFKDLQARQTVNWRFSPVEEMDYQFTGFAIVRDAHGTRRLNGVPTPHRGPYLLMGVADFPLGFVPIKASALLLAEAVIGGVCTYPDLKTQAPVEITFEVDSTHPALTLSIPLEALPQASIRLRARAPSGAPDGATVLTIGEFPARGMSLDLFDLREYGPHTIQVNVEFDTPLPLVLLDLLPAAKTEQEDAVDLLSLTPAQPQAAWRYFTPSPFKAGFRYRRHSNVGDPPGEWSAMQSPFEALKLKVSQL